MHRRSVDSRRSSAGAIRVHEHRRSIDSHRSTAGAIRVNEYRGSVNHTSDPQRFAHCFTTWSAIRTTRNTAAARYDEQGRDAGQNHARRDERIARKTSRGALVRLHKAAPQLEAEIGFGAEPYAVGLAGARGYREQTVDPTLTQCRNGMGCPHFRAREGEELSCSPEPFCPLRKRPFPLA
jgi:hypothetical protein